MRRKDQNGAASTPDGAGLSRERILDAAMALVDHDGIEALSMRRIAQQLDVWPMSLYRYFHDKDELLEALGDATAEQVDLPDPDAPWREQAAELLRGLRAAFARHPGTAGLRVDSPRHTPAAHRISEAGLALLRHAGFDEPEAARAWQALLSYTAGFPGLHQVWQGPGATPDDFDYGLQRLLDGLAQRLKERQPRGRSDRRAASPR
jgi:AcrR family transcriptional regulator